MLATGPVLIPVMFSGHQESPGEPQASRASGHGASLFFFLFFKICLKFICLSNIYPNCGA